MTIRMPCIAEMSALLDALPDPHILMDTEYRIRAANQAYRRQYGEPEGLIGMTCYQVSHRFSAPCDRSGEACPIDTARRTGRPARILHVHHTPRGEEHVDVELTPIRDSQGHIRYYVESLRRLLHADQRAQPIMVGRAPAFNRMLELLNRAAPSTTPVLLLGESGTGKELAAQTLHELSPRRDRPFVPVDCSGLTESLFESELFGYEKGAFTGATQRKIGLIEAANGGTLFLDELGDIPLGLQVKLLRLLETGTFRRVGGIETLPADFRLVAATHRDLRRMVEAGQFRRDLYYRISAFPVHLPPLRERREDLPRLAETLLARLAPTRQIRLSPAAMAHLMDYAFPGNVRELRNLLERAVLLADGDEILPEHLPEELTEPEPVHIGEMEAAKPEIVPLKEAERRYVRWALSRLEGDKAALARTLGISERTLYRKLGQGETGVRRTRSRQE